MTVRVRYGPSPTGEPHVGNIRTALFDWLFARHHGGQFIVRIEDTDQKRSVEGAEELILDALRWLGLDWDEGPDIGGEYGPYRQSERLELYQEAADRLLAEGHAYRCACSSERLAEMRKAQQKAKQPPGYDGHCRELSEAELERMIADQGGQCVVRFKMPREGVTIVDDALRGAVTFENKLLDDHVILKSDGFPTYALASIVDDTAMEITHVFRGDEWLPSAPRHVRLYDALGLKPPVFVHQPVILGPDKGKLSKRDGATSVRSYADEGFIPEAMINFMALLGWAKDDHTTLMSTDEIVAAFDLDHMGTTATTFDMDRLREMNGEHIRRLDTMEFVERGRPFLESALAETHPQIAQPLDLAVLEPVAEAIQERVKVLTEFTEYADFFFTGPAEHTNAELMGKGFRDNPAAAVDALDSARAALSKLEPWDTAGIESVLRGLAEEKELKPGVLFTPIRVALSGKRVAPPLFETMTALGREESLSRLNVASERLAAPDD
jgi:glutamyl-tRNA synthetase